MRRRSRKRHDQSSKIAAIQRESAKCASVLDEMSRTALADPVRADGRRFADAGGNDPADQIRSSELEIWDSWFAPSADHAEKPLARQPTEGDL